MSLRSPALRRDWFRVMPVEEGHRVTTLELFFDLVYVFAFTQVTAWLAHEHSWHGTAQRLLVLGLLWWTWVAWSWTGNVVRADKGVPLLGFTASMVAIFVVALTIRSVWEAEAGETAAAGVEEAVVTLAEHHSAGVAAAMLASGAALFSVSAAILMRMAGGEWRYLTASAVFFAAGALWMQPLDAILVLAITTTVLTVVGIVTPASHRRELRVNEVE